MWLKNLIKSLEILNFFIDLYLILIIQKSNIPISQEYFTTLFRENNLNRELTYLLPRTITRSTKLKAFNSKMLDNVLFFK